MKDRRTIKQRRGDQAEKAAISLLKKNGLKTLTRNFHFRGHGEIDLICRDGEEIVFVEVRFRSPSKQASAAETVDYRKQHKIISTALYYLQTNNLVDRAPCRFDVVTASPNQRGKLELEWIVNAFSL